MDEICRFREEGVRSIRLGRFEVDPATGEMIEAGERVALRPQTAQLLALLVAEPGRVVTRDEIRDALWPGSPLDNEGGINACVRELRRALHDSAASPEFIETVPKRGYRLIPPDARTSAGAVAHPHHRRRGRIGLAAVVALVLLAALAHALRRDRPMSVIVMPVPGVEPAAVERLAGRAGQHLEKVDVAIFVQRPGDVYDADAGALLRGGARIPADAVLEAGGDGDGLAAHLFVAPFDEIAWSGRSATHAAALDSLAQVLAAALGALAQNR